MRVFRFALVALAIAFIPDHSPAQAPPELQAPAMSTDSTVPVQPERTVAAAMGQPDEAPAPADGPTLPGEPFAIALAAAAARRGRKRGDVAMITDSTIHVMRGDKKERELVAIPPGKLIEDTDLTDEEVDDLTARKAIRPATPAELERIESGDVEAERRALMTEQETEVAKLRAKHEVERAELGDDAKPAAVAKLETRQASEMTKLQEQHAKALAKLDEE